MHCLPEITRVPGIGSVSKETLSLIPLWESRHPTREGGYNPAGTQRVWGLRRGGMEGIVTTWDRRLGIWETGWGKMQCQWKGDLSHNQNGFISLVQNMNSKYWRISAMQCSHDNIQFRIENIFSVSWNYLCS